MSISSQQEDRSENVMGVWEPGKARIDDMLCFALYAASRMAMDAYRPLLDEVGLTYPQYLVMLVLWEHETCSVKEIGQILRLDSGTLSPLLKRLEGVGFVKRNRRINDERVVDIMLTDEGRALQAQVADISIKVSCRYGIEFDEYIDLLGKLKKLTARLSQDGS